MRASAHGRVNRLPKYLKLAALFERQIRTGVLRVGDRLPSLRQLGEEHNVSVATAVGCYTWLERHGYVRARPKSGFFVSRLPPADDRALPPPPQPRCLKPVAVNAQAVDNRAGNGDVLDLGPAVVAPQLLPGTRLNRSVRMVLSAFGDHALRYEDARGNARLRRQLARKMFRHGATCSPDDILVTSGSGAVSLCLRAITKPGDIIAMDSPGCYEFLQALDSYRLRVIEIPHIVNRGPDLEVLANALMRHRVAAILVQASCHNVIGDRVNDADKIALVGLATRHHTPLIDSDPFGDLVFSGERPLPLKAYDQDGGVLHCGSLASYVAPGFNIGWVSAGRWHRQVERLSELSMLAGAQLPQLAMAEFLESGAFEKHLKQLRRRLHDIVAAAHDEVLRVFPTGTRVSHPEGGFVLWIQLPPKYDGVELQRRARAVGIRLLAGASFTATRRFAHCVRISCGHPLERLQPAIRTLASLLDT